MIYLLFLGAYAAIGVLAFAPVLSAWFVADDWDFLVLVAPASSVRICFVPLVGRFVRPLVMLTYYVNYHLFGLSPRPFHLTVLGLHILNAWLVSLLAARIGCSRLVAFGAGLIFLLFAGHTEAVSWVAGAADPWLVLMLIPALLLFDGGVLAERAWPALAGACAIVIAAVLAKETAVTAAALFVALGAARWLQAPTPDRRRRIAVRTLVTAIACGVLGAAYLLLRARIFGSVFGAYSELATSRGMLLGVARAFVLRSFLPPGRIATGLWVYGYDIALIAAAIAALAVLAWRRPSTRGPLLFLVAAIAIALAPSLPLTISLADTVSERYVYVATVFTAILVAWMSDLISGGRPLVAAALILLFAGVHLRALERANAGWVRAGELTRTITTETIELVRRAPASTRAMIMNLPDTVNGIFVVRGALYGSFQLMAPETGPPYERVRMIASVASLRPDAPVRVSRLAPRTFSIALEDGVFVQTGGGATPEYSFDAWTPRGYTVTFTQAQRPIQLVYVSGGHLSVAATIDSTPFGALDLPKGDAACDGASIRFSGWALGDKPGVAVSLERAAGSGAARETLGPATWRTGTRPDVTNYFRGFPDADRAEWDYELPCAAVRAAGGRLEAHVVAIDRAGQRTELGKRTIWVK